MPRIWAVLGPDSKPDFAAEDWSRSTADGEAGALLGSIVMLTDNVARKLQEMRPSNAPLLTCLSCNLRAGRIHLHSQGSEVFLTRTRADIGWRRLDGKCK